MSQSSERSSGSEDGGGDGEESRQKEEDGSERATKRSRLGGSASSQSKKEHQRRHTQNSRAKLNAKFDELLDLIQPLYKVDPRHAPHRSEVLDFAIHAYHDLIERKIFLETEIALSSAKNLSSYVKSIVQSGASFTKIAEFYLSMVCAKKQWRYGEVWCPVDSVPHLRLAGSTIHRTVTGDEMARIRRFRAESETLAVKPPCDLVGRVYHTHRTEWMNDLSDAEVFKRTNIARAANLRSVFAQIMKSSSNEILAVATFFSTDVRDYDSGTVTLASELAASVVRAHEQSIVEVRAQGASNGPTLNMGEHAVAKPANSMRHVNNINLINNPIRNVHTNMSNTTDLRHGNDSDAAGLCGEADAHRRDNVITIATNSSEHLNDCNTFRAHEKDLEREDCRPAAHFVNTYNPEFT